MGQAVPLRVGHAGDVRVVQMREHSQQRRTAEHHAALLDRVVGATRRLQSLDPDEVLEAVVGTVASLGLTWAAIAELDQRAGTFRVVRGRGLPAELESASHEIEGALTELLATGRTITSTTAESEAAGAWQAVEGFVVAPIHVRGEVVAILGGATLDEDPVPPSVAEAVELLASLAGRALELAAAFEQERESVRHVGGLVMEACDRLERLTRTHDVAFTIDEGCVAIADPQLLERVVDNLIINAVTHTPASTAVQVQVARAASRVEVEVADDGPGIPPEELQHLTDRFFRGGDPDTRPTRGLGLGLALVRDIIEQHGSQLDIESEVGGGARFSFRLPAADVPASNEQLVG